MKQKSENSFIRFASPLCQGRLQVAICLLALTCSTSIATGQDWPALDLTSEISTAQPESPENSSQPASNKASNAGFDGVANELGNGAVESDPASFDLVFDVADAEAQVPMTFTEKIRSFLPTLGSLAGSGPGNWLSSASGNSGGPDVRKIFGSLAIVIGGYFGLVWLMRIFGGSGGTGRLPREVVEVLGAAPFGPRKTLQLVRLGSKLVLILNGPEGTSPLAEITEPNEVDYLSSFFGKRRRPGSPGVTHLLSRLANRSTVPSATPVATNNNPATSHSPGLSNLNEVIRALQNLQTQTGRNVFEG